MLVNTRLVATIVLCSSWIGTARAQQCPCASSLPNVLANPGFDATGPRGPSTLDVGVVFAGSFNYSAAANWTLYLNLLGDIATEQLPADSMGAHGGALRVSIDADNGGIVQYFGPAGIPGAAVITARVYVLKGQVAIGAGNGGSTGLTEVSTTTGAWELIRTAESNRPVTEVAIYSFGGPAEFIVDEVSVRPCPAAVK
jgi:hypothetical protein